MEQRSKDGVPPGRGRTCPQGAMRTWFAGDRPPMLGLDCLARKRKAAGSF